MLYFRSGDFCWCHHDLFDNECDTYGPFPGLLAGFREGFGTTATLGAHYRYRYCSNRFSQQSEQLMRFVWSSFPA